MHVDPAAAKRKRQIGWNPQPSRLVPAKRHWQSQAGALGAFPGGEEVEMENGAATQQCPHYMPRGAWHCHTSSVPGAAQWLLISIPSLGTPDGQYPPLKWSALSLTCCVTSPFCAQISSFHSSLTAAITNVHKLGDLKCWTAGQELEVQCPQGPAPAGSSRGKHLPASRCLWCQCWHHRQRQSSASAPHYCLFSLAFRQTLAITLGAALENPEGPGDL